MNRNALTLLQLGRRIAATLATPSLQEVWVMAELSDVRISGGHCYMELIEKHPDTGAIVARARGIIWANVYGRLSADFAAATGRRFATGLKVMVCGSVNYHAAFGLSVIISAVNPEFTLGDVERRRREILMRLKQDGVLELNRELEWPEVALRIAVISAKGAAGYGDFVHQLAGNPSKLKFTARLFPATLQGEKTVPSVISAMEEIASQSDMWDCVVLIRGGGASSDLNAFDDYALASHIAQFPLPVIVGIGHERDITVLDYVANMRVKTPTAAAEWLISRGNEALEKLRRCGTDLLAAVNEKIAESRNQLSYYSGLLPVAATTATERAAARLKQSLTLMSGAGSCRVSAEIGRLATYSDSIGSASKSVIAKATDKLAAADTLLGVLSPDATLARGYSITRVDGKIINNLSDLRPGTEISTTVASGSFISVIK